MPWFSFPPPHDARPRPASAGDLSSSPRASSVPSLTAQPTQSPSSDPPARELSIIQRNRPLSILIFGTCLTLLSARATRRALIKRQAAIKPHFYHPSNEAPLQPVSGPFEAIEAFSLASIHVASWTMVWTGGILWALSVNTMDDLRKIVRRGLGVDETGADVKRNEEEFEEWIARTLERSRSKRDGKQTDAEADDDFLEGKWKDEEKNRR